MRTFLYAVYDSAAGIYEGPLKFRADGEATRWFQKQAVSGDHPIGQNPEHFSIYRLASYEDTKAVLTPETKECLATAQELITLSQNVDKKGHEQLKAEVINMQQELNS